MDLEEYLLGLPPDQAVGITRIVADLGLGAESVEELIANLLKKNPTLGTLDTDLGVFFRAKFPLRQSSLADFNGLIQKFLTSFSRWESVQNQDNITIKVAASEQYSLQLSFIVDEMKKFGWIPGENNVFSLNAPVIPSFCRNLLQQIFTLFTEKKRWVVEILGTAESWFQMGIVAERLELNTAAEVCYRGAVQHDPTCAKAWNSLAALLENKQDYSEAAKAYKQFYALEDNDPSLVDGIDLAQQCRGGIDQAMQIYQDAFGFDNDDSGTWISIGLSRNEKGDYTGAIEAFAKALKANPKLGKSWVLLGNSLESTGQSEEAFFCWEQAAQLGNQAAKEKCADCADRGQTPRKPPILT